MANTPLQLTQLGPWTGGWNPDVGEILVGRNGLTAAINVVYDPLGGLNKRFGYTAFSTSDPAGMNYGRWLASFEELDGTDHLFYVDEDEELYWVDLAAGTALTRATVSGPSDITLGNHNEKGFAGMDDVFYITSRGTGKVAYKFTAGTFAELTDNNLDGTAGDHFPEARYLINKHERLFAANIDDGATGIHASRLWWSEAGVATP